MLPRNLHFHIAAHWFLFVYAANFLLGMFHQEISVSCPCKAYGRKHKIGTIVEEKTAEESFEIEKIKNDDVEEKKVEQNGDQISRVHMSAKD